MSIAIRCLLVVLLTSAYLCAQPAGSVKGVVFDDQGRPLPKAEVHLSEAKRFVGHRLVETHETNSDGEFFIPNVPWGTYLVLAGKESSGYPDPKLAFYSNFAVPTVTLAPAFPNASVTIKLAPKGGVLEIVAVLDAVTKRKIDSASITLRRVSNPTLFISTSATIGRILIPSLTDVTIEVTAPGYRSWPAPDQAVTESRIRLKPEETSRLEVSLQRDDTGNDSRK